METVNTASRNTIGLIPYPKGKLIPHGENKWGFCNVNKQIVIEAKYSWVEPFSDGLALVKEAAGKDWTFIDENDNVVISCASNFDPKPFRHGLAKFWQNKKWGFIDKKGNIVVQPRYDWAEDYTNAGVAVVMNEKGKSLYGLIGTTGREILPTKYDSIRVVSDGLLAVCSEKGAVALFDTEGNKLTAFGYHTIVPFSEGLAEVEQNAKSGFIDQTGREVIEPQYSGAMAFSEGLAAVKSQRGKWGFIDKVNRKIIRPRYDGVCSFSEGWAMVQPLRRLDILSEKRPGFIDQSGNEVLVLDKTFTFDGVGGYGRGKFSEGLVFVKKHVRDGFYYECIMDKWGDQITEPKYDRSSLFAQGLAWVMVTDFKHLSFWGLVDKNGKELTVPKYGGGAPPSFIDGLAKVYVDQEDGRLEYYIDSQGSEYYES